MITASIGPIMNEKTSDSPMYKALEIHMQRLGQLVPFREQLNWTSPIETVVPLGTSSSLKSLKKIAARNDGSLPVILKFTKKTIYQHLMLHPNDTGLYLPFRFDAPFVVKTKDRTLWVGSSAQLMDELTWLEMTIRKLHSKEITTYWTRLREACQTALDSTSPFLLSEHGDGSDASSQA